MTPVDVAVPDQDASPRRITWPLGALGVGLIGFVLALPILLAPIVPTQDGPVHLALSEMIARYGWGGALSGAAAEFLAWNPRVEPNIGAYAVLVGLRVVTGDPLLALTGFLFVHVALWLAAAWWLGGVIAPTRRFALILFLAPLVFAKAIHSGFFNYALGLPLSLVFLALVFSSARLPVTVRLAARAIGLLLLALTHITAYGAGLAILAAHGLAEAVARGQAKGVPAGVGLLSRRALEASVAAIPAGLVVASFLMATAGATSDAPVAISSLMIVARRLVTAGYLFSFTSLEAVLLAPAALALAIGGGAALWRSDRRAGALRDRVPSMTIGIFLALIVAISLIDLQSGHGVSLSQRLAPFTWMAVAILVALHAPAGRLGSIVLGLAALGLLGQTASRVTSYGAEQSALRAVTEIGRLNPGRSFVSVDLSTLDWAPTDWRVRPHLHAASLAAAVAGGVGLSSRLLSTRYYGYFPLTYPADRDFMRATRDFEVAPDDVEGVARFGAAHPGHPAILIVIGEGRTLDLLAGRSCRVVGTGRPVVRMCGS